LAGRGGEGGGGGGRTQHARRKARWITEVQARRGRVGARRGKTAGRGVGAIGRRLYMKRRHAEIAGRRTGSGSCRHDGKKGLDHRRPAARKSNRHVTRSKFGARRVEGGKRRGRPAGPRSGGDAWRWPSPCGRTGSTNTVDFCLVRRSGTDPATPAIGRQRRGNSGKAGSLTRRNPL